MPREPLRAVADLAVLIPASHFPELGEGPPVGSFQTPPGILAEGWLGCECCADEYMCAKHWILFVSDAFTVFQDYRP